MVTLKKYNLAGKEVGEVKIDTLLAKAEANSQMVKDYIVALRANARQWSANTKGRSEVNHTTRKPHPQKGTGRARQGMLSAPQYKGGGRVHGPKPKFDQHVRINKKERRAAIRFLIGEKIRENRLHVIDGTNIDAPKTKTVTSFLKQREIGGRTLFLGEGSYIELTEGKKKQKEPGAKIPLQSDKHSHFIKSLRNLPKTTFSLATNVNGYEVLCAHHLVVSEAALAELTEWLG